MVKFIFFLGDIIVYLKRVSFVIGFFGLLICGMLFIFICVYLLVLSIRCIGRFVFLFVLFMMIFCRWGNFVVFLLFGILKGKELVMVYFCNFCERWKFLFILLIFSLWSLVIWFFDCIIILICCCFLLIGCFCRCLSSVEEV